MDDPKYLQLIYTFILINTFILIQFHQVSVLLKTDLRKTIDLNHLTEKY